MVEQYKLLLSQLTDECNNALFLRSAVIFMATLNGKELTESDGVIKITKKGGVQ
nr:MAG TPA: hypothetical protein [Bacteriophage sp.]